MVEVRPAEDDDVPALNDIANALLGSTTYEWTERPHTDDERRRWLADQRARGHPVLVAEDDDGEVVGFAAYGDFRDSGRREGYRIVVEHTVHVRQGSWGQGVARSLMDALEDHARRAGKRVVVAAIDGTNEDSMAFHARLGFAEVARMPGVGEKWGRRLDLVLMQRDLDEPRP